MSVTDGIGQTPCSLEHYLVPKIIMVEISHSWSYNKNNCACFWDSVYHVAMWTSWAVFYMQACIHTYIHMNIYPSFIIYYLF